MPSEAPAVGSKRCRAVPPLPHPQRAPPFPTRQVPHSHAVCPAAAALNAPTWQGWSCSPGPSSSFPGQTGRPRPSTAGALSHRGEQRRRKAAQRPSRRASEPIPLARAAIPTPPRGG